MYKRKVPVGFIPRETERERERKEQDIAAKIYEN